MDPGTYFASLFNRSAHKSPTPGRHVTITVRETKTEKLSGPDGPGTWHLPVYLLGSISTNIRYPCSWHCGGADCAAERFLYA